MDTQFNKNLLETALDLGEKAADLISRFQLQNLNTQFKEDQSPVTQADLQADQLIREGLQKKFPHHAIVTEEYGLIGNEKSEFVWMVDPLDGTKAYAKKRPGYCVMIGLLREGKPYLGVVVDPEEGHTYHAVRGEGTKHHYHGEVRAIQVSRREYYSQMPLVISTGFPEKPLQQAIDILKSPLVDPINSVGIKVGLLVRQVGDIYLNHHSVYYWDTCAPHIILEEAGGCMTRLDGGPLSYDLNTKNYNHGSATLATNNTRHQDLIQLFKEVGLGDDLH